MSDDELLTGLGKTVSGEHQFNTAENSAARIDAVMSALLKQSRGYGSLSSVVDQVDALRRSVDASSLPTDSLQAWAATLRTGSMAAQRYQDDRWYEWFVESWQLAIELEDFDVLHDLCGDLSALQPNLTDKTVSDVRMRGAIGGFALASAADNQTRQLKSLARNTDRLLWTGDIEAARHTVERHEIRRKIETVAMPLPDYCLVLDSLCAVAVATGDLKDALELANELEECSAALPIYQAHAYFHIGMIAVRRFNFGRARECLDKLDVLSLQLGSVDAAENMRTALRNAWNTGRTPEPMQTAHPHQVDPDPRRLAQLTNRIDQAVTNYGPALAKILPRFTIRSRSRFPFLS